MSYFYKRKSKGPKVLFETKNLSEIFARIKEHYFIQIYALLSAKPLSCESWIIVVEKEVIANLELSNDSKSKSIFKLQK